MDIITILLCYVSALIVVHGENGASGDTTRLVVMEPSSLPTPIATSAQTFEDLMNQGNIFIDKTLFIKNLVINKANYPIRVIARPKGWGKTVNLKMLETFFSAEVDPINYKIRPRNQTQAFRLFEHSEVISPNDEVRKLDQPLLITQYTEIMSMHQGVYPVVYMDFSGIKGRYSTEFEVEMLTRVNLLEEKYELKSIVEVLRASGQYVDKKMLEILNLNTEPKTSTSKKSKSETEKKTTVPLELKDNTKTLVSGPAKPDSGDIKAVDSKRGAETTKAGEIKLAGLKKMAEEVEKKILEKEAAKTATVTKTTKAKPTGPKVTLANATTVPSKRKKKTTLPNIPGVRIIDLDRAEELEREGMFDTTPDPKVEDNPKMFKNDTELKNAWARKLKCICNLLGIYFQRKPVILIDNYDDPFIQVISQPGVLRRTDAMRSMWQFYNILFDQFKNDTRFYSLLVVSGMMRIGLPGLMKDFELEQSGRFIPPSGFTEKEVDMIFEHINMPTTLRTQAHAYYGGYQFSEYEYNMFHPSSIASFVATKKAKRYLRSDGAIDKYFEKCLRDTNRKVNEDPVSRHLCGRVLRDAGHLIKGITELDLKHFSGYKELSEEISKVFPTTAAALCYAAGYITLERHTSSEEAFGEVGLKVPNQEIKDLMISQPEFEDIIYKWSDEDDKPTADDSHDFMPDDSAVKVTKGTKKTSLK